MYCVRGISGGQQLQRVSALGTPKEVTVLLFGHCLHHMEVIVISEYVIWEMSGGHQLQSASTLHTPKEVTGLLFGHYLHKY